MTYHFGKSFRPTAGWESAQWSNGRKKIILRLHIIPHLWDMTFFFTNAYKKKCHAVSFGFWENSIMCFLRLQIVVSEKIRLNFLQPLKYRKTIFFIFLLYCKEKENESCHICIWMMWSLEIFFSAPYTDFRPLHTGSAWNHIVFRKSKNLSLEIEENPLLSCFGHIGAYADYGGIFSLVPIIKRIAAKLMKNAKIGKKGKKSKLY